MWFDESGEFTPTANLKPHLDVVNRVAANMAKASESLTIRSPFKWPASLSFNLPDLDKEALELYYGMPQRCLTGINPAKWDAAIIDERSKPVGLTKEHVYTDEDGDTIEVQKKNEGEPHAVIGVKDESYAYIQPEYSIPLALNVLGYDRPSAKPYAAGPTKYRDATANEAIPGSQIARDTNIAKAIDLLIGADIYDQRIAKRKADEDAKVEADKAALASYVKHKQESFDRAKLAYADAIRDQIASGIDAESAAKVQAALSAYETARRKLEGLPS